MIPLAKVSRRSFKHQIIRTFVFGFFMLAAAFAVYLVSNERESLYRDSSNSTTGLAQSLAVSSLSWVLANDVVGLQEVVQSFRDYPELRYAMVISPAGRVMGHSDGTKVGQYLADEPSLALIKAAPVKRVLRDDPSVIDVAVPIVIGDRHVGWARVGLGREVVARNLRQLILSSTLYVIFATLLSLLAAVIVANRLGQRIASLVTVAQQVQGGNFETRVLPMPGKEDELTGLARSLNLMLDTLAQNEEQLREVSRYTRSLIEASLDPLVTISPEGRITDVNQATEKATGRHREELIGSDFSECFVDPDKARSAYKEAFLRGFITDYPLVLRHLDGHVASMLYNVNVYRNEQGEVLGLFASARDTTEHQRATLARSELAAIVESSSDAIIGKTPYGIITSWNSGAEQMYGYRADETVGKHVSMLAPESLRVEVDELMVKVRNGEAVTNHESRRVRKDGKQIDVSLTLSPIHDASGRITGISTIARDISERKHLEEAHAANLHYLECMDMVNRAMQGEKDLDGMLSDVLDVVLEIFDCDRVGLVYPCNPMSPEWRIMMERAKPGYGTEPKRGQLPMTEIRATSMQCMLEKKGPVQFSPESDPSSARVESFGIRSFMAMALHPRLGDAWEFGIHQCQYVRSWNAQEERLFEEIGHRLADGLNTMLVYRNLQESEQRYRLVFEKSPISIWEEDFSELKTMMDKLRREGVTDIGVYFTQHPEVVLQYAQSVKIIDVNDAVLELHGAENKQELFAGLVDTFTPESFETFRDEMVALWNGTCQMVQDAVVKTLAGEQRKVTIYFSVCPGYEETLSKVLVSLVDITERKQIEEALSASEAELRALINAMTDVIFVGNAEGRYLKIVETNSSLLYRPSNELVGKTLHEIFPQEQADFFLSQISQALSRLEPVNFEYSLPIGGRELWFSATVSPMSDEKILMVARDITDRKQSEETLKNTAMRLNDAQRIAHLGNWELDLVNNVLHWSDEIYRIFEIDPQQFGASYEAFLNAIHPEDRDMVNKAYTDSVADKVPYDIVHRLRMPDGRIKYVNEKCETHYSVDGRPLRSVGTVHDITERKLDEEALRRLNRELRAISDCNQALVRAVDEQALLDEICQIACDKAGYRMAWVGYPENDASKTIRPVAWAGFEQGYLAQAHFTWADTERGRGPSGSAIRSGMSVSISDFDTDSQAAPWRDSALQRGYRSSIALPLIDETENTFGILNIYSSLPNAFTSEEVRLLEELASNLAFGITRLRALKERVLAEDALKLSEERYRTLIQKIQAAVVVHGADTKILTCNSMAQEMLGIAKEQMLGKMVVDPAWHFYNEDGAITPIDEYPVSRVLASGQPLRNLVLGVHRPSNEKDVWVLVNADPVFSEAGKLVEIIVTFIDISERKEAEQALRESRQRLNNIVANSPGAIYRCANDTEWTMEFLSAAITRITGYPAEDFINNQIRSFASIIHPDDRRMVKQVVSASLARRERYELDYRLIAQDGTLHWVHEQGQGVVSPDGQVLYLDGVIFDITDQRNAEEEIRKLNQELEQRVADRTAELEAAINELEAFSYSVSHDLRTPLRAIDGFSQILLEDYAGNLDDEGKRLFSVVRDNTIRMGHLIDDILKFSRAGRLEMNFSEIDMDGMARDVFDELLLSVAEVKPRLKIEQLPPARGDRATMHQVFVNLFANAIKFSRTREAPLIKVGARVERNETIYYVKDNGVGFDMQYAGKLFGVFQRLHPVDEFEGTGIGLAIVKRIISRHGGRVWAEGKINEGATFYFSIPGRASPAEEHD